MWNILHSIWTVVFLLECCVIPCKFFGSYCTTGCQFHLSLNGICFSEYIMDVAALQEDRVFAT